MEELPEDFRLSWAPGNVVSPVVFRPGVRAVCYPFLGNDFSAGKLCFDVLGCFVFPGDTVAVIGGSFCGTGTVFGVVDSTPVFTSGGGHHRQFTVIMNNVDGGEYSHSHNFTEGESSGIVVVDRIPGRLCDELSVGDVVMTSGYDGGRLLCVVNDSENAYQQFVGNYTQWYVDVVAISHKDGFLEPSTGIHSMPLVNRSVLIPSIPLSDWRHLDSWCHIPLTVPWGVERRCFVS